jgi:hypothetical protein
MPFAIKNLLNEERCFGGGQPYGLAAASAWGCRPPKAGGSPQNTTGSYLETLWYKNEKVEALHSPSKVFIPCTVSLFL